MGDLYVGLAGATCVYYHHLTSALTAAQNRNGGRPHPEISLHTDADHRTEQEAAPKTHTDKHTHCVKRVWNMLMWSVTAKTDMDDGLPCVILCRLTDYFQCKTSTWKMETITKTVHYHFLSIWCWYDNVNSIKISVSPGLI